MTNQNDLFTAQTSAAFIPSSYQTNIFTAFRKRERNLLVQAVAGSGKTKTMEEALKFLQRSESAICLAFNKAIAEELQRRVPSGVEASTLNSVGHRTWMRFAGRVTLDSAKIRVIARDVIPFDLRDLQSDVVALVQKAKVHGIVPNEVAAIHPVKGLMTDDDSSWLDLAARYGIELPVQYGRHLNFARQILSRAVLMKNTIDFDDQLYMPIVWGATFRRFDRILVDEAQDLSEIQIAMITRMGGPDTRYMIVGDRQQALYQFRGADSRAMDRLKTAFDCEELPLSVTYRCPASVVREAQRWVPHIESRPGAPEGTVVTEGGYYLDIEPKPGDMVVCRRNLPVITMAYSLISRKIKVRVQGRDLAEGLRSLVRQLKAKDAKDLIARIKGWTQKQVDNLRAADEEEKIEAVLDKANTLITIIVSSAAQTISEVENSIEALFSGDGPCVLLSSVHRAKGLEADNVFVIDIEKSFAIRSDEDRQTETNIKYVAVTRAKSSLTFISTNPVVRKGGMTHTAAETAAITAGVVSNCVPAAAMAASMGIADTAAVNQNLNISNTVAEVVSTRLNAEEVVAKPKTIRKPRGLKKAVDNGTADSDSDCPF